MKIEQFKPAHADRIDGYDWTTKKGFNALEDMLKNETVIVQKKHDGERIKMHIDGSETAMDSRRISKKTGLYAQCQQNFPEWQNLNVGLGYCVLDGELKAIRNGKDNWSDIVGVIHSLPERAQMIKDLETAIGYRFRNISLLQNALTHSSYANERWHNSLLSNERLEFLGDSVLGMLVADYLYQTFPNRPEGELTRMRADMVCEKTLAAAANRIGIGAHLLLGHGEEQGGGRSRDSILADAMESVIAACFLDGGLEAAHKIVQQFILVEVPVTKMHNADYKTTLQELVQQKKNQVLTYALVGESGPDHDKKFDVEVKLNGKVVGSGSGSSKKRAEQMAARAAIENLFPDKK